MMTLNTDRLRRKLWIIAAAIWLAAAAIAIAGMFALSSLSHAEPDTVYTDDFEFHCGFGTDAPRQMVGVIRYPGQFPEVVTLDAWGALFGDVFPFVYQVKPIMAVNTRQFVALAFTTRDLPKDDTSGRVSLVQSYTTPGSLAQFTISPRCGDFDAAGPWLSAHPTCSDTPPIKQNFTWATVPSPSACSLLVDGINDPSRTWWLNMRVVRCAGLTGDLMPLACDLNLINAQ